MNSCSKDLTDEHIYIWFLSSMNFLIKPKMLPHSWYLYGFSVVWILWPTVGCEVQILSFKDFHHTPQSHKLLSCMDFLMFSECWDLSKGFSTLETSERFLYMYSPMTSKVWILTETLATLMTSKRSLSSMNSPMMSKMWFLTKDFSTLITSVRFLTSMNCLNALQGVILHDRPCHTHPICKVSLQCELSDALKGVTIHERPGHTGPGEKSGEHHHRQ